MRSLLLRSLAIIAALYGVVDARNAGPHGYRHSHHAKRYQITDPEHANAISQNPSNAKVHAGLNKRQDYTCGPGQHGFCGTTSEFCDDKCQSNCGKVNRPSGGGNVRKNVVGYYESWQATSKRCSRMQPEEVPAAGLTHLNFAFAFVTPNSYDVVPMPDTDPNLFSRTTALKRTYPGLEVWISVGGWTFNDNGTIWQPVFSDLASSQAKRSKFINNMIKFMVQYGFDGCDLDWYVKLSSENNKSSVISLQQFGLSFTAPTSFWYLRWFDLEKIHPNVDFINVMSYDLHGIWDANNPIGAHVLGHSNMTEIDCTNGLTLVALDLFWRTKVPSNKVHLGFGFYGRSFKLKNPSCSDPGCPFEGPADAGPCTDTAGILSYKEIQSLIDATGGAKPKYDKSAQVKYLTWGSGNWISYDDKATYEAKVDFGNKRGLNGMLIWAVDQDDRKWTAMKAVTGKHELTTNEFQNVPESDLLPKDCYVTGLCGTACAAGYLAITDKIYYAYQDRLHDPNADFSPKRCGKDKQRSLCCPFSSHPLKYKCHWRGDEGHCNGRCHDGEVFMVGDNQGDNKKACLK
ncbi:Chitotriosidase-1 [Orbilia brochopaga]|nr:Chitotriosidase-1 [Drechslerella brochopaga]